MLSECDFETCHDTERNTENQEGIGLPNPRTIGDRRPSKEPHMISGKARSPGANGKRSLCRDPLDSALKETGTWKKRTRIIRDGSSPRSTKDKRTKKACSKTYESNSRKKERKKTKLVRLSKKFNKIWRKRTPEPLKQNGNYAVLFVSTYKRGKNGTPAAHREQDVADDADQDTTTMNLEKDLEERMIKVKQARWTGSTKTTGFWAEEEEHDP